MGTEVGGLVLTISLSLANFVTMCLHMLGFYLLYCQYRNGVQESQQLYLMNLALAEGFANLLQLLMNPLHEIFPMSTNSTNTFKKCQYYFKTIRGYGVVSVYFLTMHYLTIDKLLDVLLSIKYTIYWNENQTCILLKGTWTLCLTMAVALSIVYNFTGFDFHIILDIYVYPMFGLLFIITASIAYGFIFYKFNETRIPPPIESSRGTRGRILRPSVVAVFQKSLFFIPVLLVSTFIIFMVIPEWIHLFEVVLNKNDDLTINTILRFLWTLSYFCDAIIYIWLKPSVKRLLKKKISFKRRKNVLARAPINFSTVRLIESSVLRQLSRSTGHLFEKPNIQSNTSSQLCLNQYLLRQTSSSTGQLCNKSI